MVANSCDYRGDLLSRHSQALQEIKSQQRPAQSMLMPVHDIPNVVQVAGNLSQPLLPLRVAQHL